MNLLVLLAAAIAAPILGYNLLVRRRNAMTNAFAGIDTMLQMRYDLIPNLVATVQGYAKHESETFREIAELRAKAMQPGLGTNERVHLDN
jgi:LemA protein